MESLDLTPFIRAFETDLAGGDRTTRSLELGTRQARAAIIARQSGVMAGATLIASLCRQLQLPLTGTAQHPDGAQIEAGVQLGTLEGDAAAMLAVERTLLNGLQLLAGIATETARWRAKLPANVVLTDTRKTHAGLRAWEKAAFRAGGGVNHRFSLADVIMLKDNHLALAGGVTQAVASARRHAGPGCGVLCEVESLQAARDALDAGATGLLVDNVAPAQWPTYWALVAQHHTLEFSGGIIYDDLDRIPTPPRPIFVSSSQPIFAAPTLDIALEVAP